MGEQPSGGGAVQPPPGPRPRWDLVVFYLLWVAGLLLWLLTLFSSETAASDIARLPHPDQAAEVLVYRWAPAGPLLLTAWVAGLVTLLAHRADRVVLWSGVTFLCCSGLLLFLSVPKPD